MTELASDFGIGQIQIADEVIAIIAGTASMEVNGVASTGNRPRGDITGKIGRKNLSRGIRVSVTDKDVSVDLSLVLKFGYKIQDVSVEVQKKVKTAIETMTGLTAKDINIYIAGVTVEKDKQKDNPAK